MGKYFRLNKWKAKGIKEGWWVTCETIDQLCDNMSYIENGKIHDRN